MTRRIVKTSHTTQDLVEHFAYIGRDNLEAAQRFLASATEAFEQLAEMPGIGRRRAVRNPRLEGLRSWRIQGFEKYLIFYRQRKDAIEIVRVLHGARDIAAILEQEE